MQVRAWFRVSWSVSIPHFVNKFLITLSESGISGTSPPPIFYLASLALSINFLQNVLTFLESQSNFIGSSSVAVLRSFRPSELVHSIASPGFSWADVRANTGGAVGSTTHSSNSLTSLSYGSGSGTCLTWSLWDLGDKFSKRSFLRYLRIGLFTSTFYDLLDMHYGALLIVFVMFLLCLHRWNVWRSAPFLGDGDSNPQSKI